MRTSSWARGAAVGASLVVCAVAAQANRYTLVDLGPELYLATINDHDQVVGTTNPERAFFWTGDHWHRLSGSESYAFGIDADGDVVGSILDAPVLWRRHEAGRTLPLPDGASQGWAYDVNAEGAVAGTYVGSDGYELCFEWSEATGPVGLGLFDRGLTCSASAINAHGQITGGVATKGLQFIHAFRFEAGEFQDLGSMGETGQARGDYSTGYAINSRGDIAGYSLVPPIDKQRWHAVLWRGTRLIDLDPDSLYAKSQAKGINDRGDIVGVARNGDGYPEHENAARFLNPGIVLLDTEVSNLGHWHVFNARAVNAQGNIVAQALGPKGQVRTVLLRLDSTD